METTTNSAKKFLNSIITKPSNQFFLNSYEINTNKNTSSNLDYGGSSNVFKTNYRGTEVAIKELLITKNSCRHTLKLFKREISSLQLILHPNLVLFMGAIAEPNKLCIVTEYCSGGTLYNFLQNKQNKISWKFRIRILYEIAITMNFLHLNKPQILHRDLKTSNILLTEEINGTNNECSIKINDFGLSKIIKSIDMSKSNSDCLGTVQWMAPEVIKQNKYSTKCDVYSFGIIMWEIATRKKLYENMNQSQIIYKVCFEKGRPEMQEWDKFNAPKDYRELMEKCWDDDENKRPDFKEIIDDIKKIREKYHDNNK
jgi:serine/threonine protein kinase